MSITAEAREQVSLRFEVLMPHLNERQRRLLLATEARLLTITPYDKNSIKTIEKSILESDVGLTPSNDGQVIRLTFPQLTEERRKDLVKVVKTRAEEGRVSVRNVRRDARKELEALIAASAERLDAAELDARLVADRIDVTMPGAPPRPLGTSMPPSTRSAVR